jgi:F-box/leucine-rich repeat protein 7
MILEKKKKETSAPSADLIDTSRRGSKRLRDLSLTDQNGASLKFVNKKRKSPSPGLADGTSSALANGLVNVRLLLKELPLFAGLPPEILHFLGLNAQPRSFPPFTDIIKQDSQGREVYFIVRGEVEVLSERTDSRNGGFSLPTTIEHPGFEVKARLKQGQYFGEVVSLSLAPRRTATVRSISAVECLMISGEVLAQFWDRCPQDVRDQVEQTAKDRLKTASDGDVVMSEAVDTPDGPSTNDDRFKIRASRRQSMPLLTLTETELDGTHKPNGIDDHTALRPSDPDPFLNVGLDNVRLRSRRGSVAPPTPEEVTRDQQRASPTEPRSSSSSFRSLPETSATPVAQKAKREPSNDNHGIIPDNLLVRIFDHLELHDILGLRAVSLHWSEIINTSADLLHYLDLSVYNRCLTDDVLAKIICPFIGNRPRYIDISNCFHVTDEGFNKLVSTCGSNIVTWKMKSVWDVTASAILEMSSKATGLEEVDLSNCRKVSDTLLARIIGWATPGPYKPPEDSGKSGKPAIKPTIQTPKGAIFGCPNLKRLTLSYCKHVTDRSMHHIASHAASRIEAMDLTRCTTITDHGFQFWGNAQFTNLRKLCLADCTYLTDNAIVYLTNAAKGLQELDLVRTSLLP